MKTALLAIAGVLAASAAHAAIGSSEAARLADSAAVVRAIQAEIPTDVWSRAHCAIVIPDLKKAAFVVGGEYGAGVMSCRSGTGWSAPVFMQLIRGSWGFQLGAEQLDVVALVMNEEGVQKLLESKVTLGAGISAVAGPVGQRKAVETDAQMSAEILTYTRAQGLFAGANVTGGVLRPDEDANADAYGANATPRTILASRALSAPPEALAFLNALGAVPTSAAAAAAAGAAAIGNDRSPSAGASSQAASAGSATPDDLRARVAEMQRTLDRLLAGAEPSPVGTAGAAGGSGSTVIVDRAQLNLLREQLDALARAATSR